MFESRVLGYAYISEVQSAMPAESMSTSDYYTLLQINRESSADEIRAAYHRALLLHHPDKRRGESQVPISLLKTAYEILSSTSRSAYDATLCHEKVGTTRRPASVVSLDEFEQSQDRYSYTCRCGGAYRITTDELGREVHLLACDGCSETIWVAYEVVMEDEG